MTANRRVLRFFSVLFALLAISNLSKPLEAEAEHGFVFLGRRLSDTPNLVIAPLFAAFQATYAFGLWTARRFALVMGIVYAGWVPLNIYLFTVRSPEELGTNSLFGVTYTTIAVLLSLAPVVVMLRARDELS